MMKVYIIIFIIFTIINSTFAQNNISVAEAKIQNSREVNLKEITIPEGPVKGYYPNGNLRFESYYKNGKLEGKFKFYYESGILQTEKNYKNDKEEGLCKWYYENGNLESERNYKEGKLDGITKTYHEDGTLWTEEYYKDGELVKENSD
ncbi:MAG: toxin-antitoxin system YwqK family antitoxin [Candidatus Omnitrophota bacterium]